MVKESAGTVAPTSNLFLLKEPDSNIDRDVLGGKLEHEQLTGSWKMNKILHAGLIIEV